VDHTLVMTLCRASLIGFSAPLIDLQIINRFIVSFMSVTYIVYRMTNEYNFDDQEAVYIVGQLKATQTYKTLNRTLQ